MSAARRLLAGPLPAALVLAAVVAGCASVSTPDEAGWRDQARQSLEDASGEVATARLTLVQLTADRLPQAYAVTLAADAEEAAGTVEESLASVQAPAALRDTAEDVVALLGRAVDAVRAARVAVVAGTEPSPAVRTDLAEVQRELDGLRAEL